MHCLNLLKHCITALVVALPACRQVPAVGACCGSRQLGLGDTRLVSGQDVLKKGNQVMEG
jgi:hypothetical protein